MEPSWNSARWDGLEPRFHLCHALQQRLPPILQLPWARFLPINLGGRQGQLNERMKPIYSQSGVSLTHPLRGDRATIHTCVAEGTRNKPPVRPLAREKDT